MRTCLAVVMGLVLLGVAEGGTFDFAHGPLRLEFDSETGALTRIRLRAQVLAEAHPGAWPVTFAVGPKDRPTWLDGSGASRKLVARRQPQPDTLEVVVRVGEFELVERYRLHADAPRLDRSAVLTNRGGRTVKLRGLLFRTSGIVATAEGFYRFPKRWPPQGYAFAEMQPGRQRGGGGTIAPLVAQLSPDRSLLWASCTDDVPYVRVREGKGRFDVVQGLQAAGYLCPGQPQRFGTVSFIVADCGYWDALPKFWDWMESVGITVPKDIPDWLHGAILYEFHPGGTIGSRWRDIGGFAAATERLLPSIRRLGCTAIWVQPIEYRSPYWPLDYYRFMDGLGTAADYRALVRRAHELGLRVLQDIVPHGGAPQAVHNKRHPEFMLRREDGSTLTYWLNDFARPDWQDYIAKVAAHYVRQFDIDGYRIDACFGSKEMNWDPAIPYARASLARLWGGLRMVARIRREVKRLKPREGAVLAEVESTRHAAVSDFQYDFGLCYVVLHGWRRMPPERFVPALGEYLEEQKFTNPPGTLFLRHIESHDSLRAQFWYGVEGMRAMYALSALIRGVPLIYLDMDLGHAFALRRINRLRSSRPELARGEAHYRAVHSSVPGVFACLRKLGDRETVVAINFNRSPVRATLRWPGGQAAVDLPPLGYALVPPEPEGPPIWMAIPVGRVVETEQMAFPDAKEWFVETIEGRLHDEFSPRHADVPPQPSSIYWRPQPTGVLWQNETVPLHPVAPRLGVKKADGSWTILSFEGPVVQNVRLVERHEGKHFLHVLGLGGLKVRVAAPNGLPAPPSEPFRVGRRLSLRCVGPDYVVSNRHYTVVLRRQGGVVRELVVGGKVLAADHDLYGDQPYFELRRAGRIAAGNDVECGIKVWAEGGKLHLRFEGQLRGFHRFSLKRPALWYRNEYVFDDGPNFTQRWAFRTQKPFEGQQAFLAAVVALPGVSGFRFLREGKAVGAGPVGEGGPRRAETKGDPPPEAVEFLDGGRVVLRLDALRAPAHPHVNFFVHARRFYATLLDGRGASMEAGKWYAFEARWTAGQRP